MKTKTAKLLLTALLMLSLVGTAFATNTTATVPVTLTVSNEYRAVNVTLPVSLPVEVINGVVYTADNATITNNAVNGAVQVTAISLTDGAYKVGSYENFSGAKTIALEINGCPSLGAGDMGITDIAFPAIEAGGNLTLTYHAKVSADAPNAEAVNAANVVFTIAIVE